MYFKPALVYNKKGTLTTRVGKFMPLKTLESDCLSLCMCVRPSEYKILVILWLKFLQFCCYCLGNFVDTLIIY